MTTERVEAPRSAREVLRKRRGINWEKWGWIYMRVSGILLVFLIFSHLYFNLFAGEGVNAIDWGFVAGKWANPYFYWSDLLLLWLALIHGANGMRTLVNDYAYNPLLRKLLLGAILASTIVLLALGTLVITTFDPCLGDPRTTGLQELCAAL